MDRRWTEDSEEAIRVDMLVNILMTSLQFALGTEYSQQVAALNCLCVSHI